MNIQKINDFKKIVNRETILALLKEGVELDDIWEVLAERVWADWKNREYAGYCILATDYGHEPVKLTEDLRSQLPRRLSNFRNIVAEVIFVQHLTALGYKAENAPIALDYAGVDVVLTDKNGLHAYVAVLRNTPISWSMYYRKYGDRSECHYYFTFENIEEITLEYVQKWTERNL